MAKPSVYDNAAISVEGKLLADAASISVQYMDSDKPILLLDGTMTVAPSGRLMTVEVLDYFTVDGPEHELLKDYLSSRRIGLGIQLIGSGKRLITTGFLKAPSLTAAVRQTLAFKVGFIGAAADWL